MHPYFCTWPGCDKTFPNRSTWARHEEAVHYCPYHWVCCLDTKTVMRLPKCFVCGERDVLLTHIIEHHFGNCESQPEESRIYYRKDQLSQHIKRTHADKKKGGAVTVPDELLLSWKRDNPSPSRLAGHCGFCGMVFGTWAKRQKHVVEHMHRHLCKSSWWHDRLPTMMPQLPRSVTSLRIELNLRKLKLRQFGPFYLSRMSQ